jgi:cytochrome c oxidase assembly protein subunit 11
MRHASLTTKLVALAGAMFLFGFALVPLYDAFCALTGYGGKTASTSQNVSEVADPTRTVRLELLGSVARSAPWEFRPAVSHLEVHPGQMYETTFRARNLTGRPLVAQAVPSVAPGRAAAHLRKVECFCFTQQPFEPHEERDLQLRFMVDRDLPADVTTLSLAYTMFAVED